MFIYYKLLIFSTNPFIMLHSLILGSSKSLIESLLLRIYLKKDSFRSIANEKRRKSVLDQFLDDAKGITTNDCELLQYNPPLICDRNWIMKILDQKNMEYQIFYQFISQYTKTNRLLDQSNKSEKKIAYSFLEETIKITITFKQLMKK